MAIFPIRPDTRVVATSEATRCTRASDATKQHAKKTSTVHETAQHRANCQNQSPGHTEDASAAQQIVQIFDARGARGIGPQRI